MNELEYIYGQIAPALEPDAQKMAVTAHLYRSLSALVRLAGNLSLQYALRILQLLEGPRR